MLSSHRTWSGNRPGICAGAIASGTRWIGTLAGRSGDEEIAGYELLRHAGSGWVCAGIIGKRPAKHNRADGEALGPRAAGCLSFY